MKLTKEKAEQMMSRNGGYLDLRGTGITALPDNLIVDGTTIKADTWYRAKNGWFEEVT